MTRSYENIAGAVFPPPEDVKTPEDMNESVGITSSGGAHQQFNGDGNAEATGNHHKPDKFVYHIVVFAQIGLAGARANVIHSGQTGGQKRLR
jgi:hypothetical protein